MGNQNDEAYHIRAGRTASTKAQEEVCTFQEEVDGRGWQGSAHTEPVRGLYFMQ